MASYLVRTKQKITRQAGDTGTIDFIVPVEISLVGLSGLFQVRDKRDVLLFEKLSPTDITIVGQAITVLLDGSETAEQSGLYDWELQVSDVDTIITLGKGVFEIVKEIAR